MDIIIDNVVTVKNPTDEVKRWAISEFTVPNPEYAKKARMGFWLGNTPKTICLYETKGTDLILPYGVLRQLVSHCDNDDTLSSVIQKNEAVDYGGVDVPLYDYQAEAVHQLMMNIFGILQSPPGSGKTQMAIDLIKAYKKKALWLTHTLDLVNQSKARAEMFIDKDLIGTITEGKVNIGSGVTFATVQTMAKLDLSKYKNEWDVIIVDECHRVAGSPTSVTMFYKVINSLSAAHKFGLSATVHRADDMIKCTFALLGGVVHNVPEEAVAGKIMKVGICPIDTGIGLDRTCLNTDGTLNYAKLINYLSGNSERAELIVNEIIQNQGHSSLILSDRLEHLEKMMNTLPIEMRQDAVMISGKMTSKTGKAEREQALKDMRNGEKKYLFATYSLAKEGLDVPRLDRLYLTTPQKDYAVITQSVGRIARTFEGKSEPIAYDFVDNAGYLVKSYKKRCSTYKKIGCYFVEER